MCCRRAMKSTNFLRCRLNCFARSSNRHASHCGGWIVERYTGILGIAAILAFAYLVSSNRRAIQARSVFWGIGLQIVIAVVVLKVEWGRRIVEALGDAITWLLTFSYAGSKF